MDLKQYGQILWKRRLWALVAFGLVVGSTAAVTFTTPPVYRATTKLLLEQKDSTLSALGNGGAWGELSSLSRTGSPIDTQVELVRSGPVVGKVIQVVNLRDTASGQPLSGDSFLGSGKVATVKGTDLIQISFEHTDPSLAAQVADVWAKTYVDENRLANRMEASSAARFIAQQLDKTKAELSDAETKLRDYKAEHGAIDLSEEARASVNVMASVEAELRAAEAQSAEASARVTALRRQVGVSSGAAMAATALSQDPSVLRLRQQILEAETNPVLSDPSLTPDNPSVKAAQAQITTLRKALSEAAKAVAGRNYGSGEDISNFDPVRQTLTRSLIESEVNALAYDTRVASLRSRVGSYAGRLDSLPDKELALTRLVRNASVTAELYKMLLQKHEEVRIQEAMNIGNVRVVEEAMTPKSPIRPKRSQNMFIGLLVGLMAAVGAALFLEYLDDTLQTADDAEKVLNLPVLGIIPWLKAQDAAQLVTMTDARSPASEAYRTLRTNIKFLSADAPLRSMTITSAGPEEGKSTTVANLAVAFAQGGKRVLLVDSDMRKPTVHQIFKLANDKGLSTVLAGEHRPENCIQSSAQVNLDIMPCGPLPPNPAELIDSARMSALIEELKTRYDMVIFDAPPIIAVTDASILASKLDGLILLLGMTKVTRKAATHAQALLERAKVKVWGMVVRGVRPDTDGYYYSYYHRYYGHVDKEVKRDRAEPVVPPVTVESNMWGSPGSPPDGRT